jgi:hypothetical protein
MQTSAGGPADRRREAQPEQACAHLLAVQAGWSPTATVLMMADDVTGSSWITQHVCYVAVTDQADGAQQDTGTMRELIQEGVDLQAHRVPIVGEPVCPAHVAAQPPCQRCALGVSQGASVGRQTGCRRGTSCSRTRCTSAWG